MAGAEDGGQEKYEYPIGFRFKPKDDELIQHYLLPTLQHGEPAVSNDCVIKANVYESHPDTLTEQHRSGDGEQQQDAWYFLSPRFRMYRNGTRPARKTKDGRGRWKASTATKEVAEEVVLNGTRYAKSVLNYFEGNCKEEDRTKWIMLELTIPDYEISLGQPEARELLDRFVMCKIYLSPQDKKFKDDDAVEKATSSAFQQEEEPCSSSMPRIQGAPGPKMCEKQAGKRPMVPQPQGWSATPAAQKQARRQPGSLRIATSTTQTSGGSTSTPAGNASRPQVRYAVPGQQPQPPTMTQRTVLRNQPFFGQTTMRPPNANAANQVARVPGYLRGNPPRQHPGAGRVFRPQVSLQCQYDHNYRATQPPAPGNASYTQQLQPTQPPPFFYREVNGGAGPAAVTQGQGTPFNSYPYERSPLTPPAECHGGGGPANVRRFDVNSEQFFVDLATINPSLAGVLPPPAPAAAAAATARVETETTGEASGLNKQDTDTA